MDFRGSRFRRSSKCVGDVNPDECVEVAIASDAVALRDSKNASAEPKVFTFPEWAAFVAGVKAGEFDV
jgi:Domain of unknown function (DUF397)